jgi:hypothetical protein
MRATFSSACSWKIRRRDLARAANLLVELGHDPATIRAEDFGPLGE